MLGSCPRDQTGQATEARCDFGWRGGTLTIGRRIRPSRTAASPGRPTPSFRLGQALAGRSGDRRDQLDMPVRSRTGCAG
jgi:hypothetical protein